MSTPRGFALSTTTILFYKKKLRRQYKCLREIKRAAQKNHARHFNQVRFGLFSRSLWLSSFPMSVKSTGQPVPNNGVRFEIKSAQLPLVALMLKSGQWDVVASDLLAQYGVNGERSDFFDQDPVVLDFSGVETDTPWTDMAILLQSMRTCRLVPVAFRAEPAAWVSKLQGLGLVQAPATPGKVSKPHEKTTPQAPLAVREAPAPATMVIDKPVRSGQKIYARGADLVVMAMVNPGAEVVADGNIHVYAPLRGKAMAGARGNVSARIFSLCLEPELVSIAGVYRTSETPLSKEVAGKAAQVRLCNEDGKEKLLIEPLKT